MAMIDDEQLLDTLCEAWREATNQLIKASGNGRAMDFWSGVMNGLACSIAAASGIPERIGFLDAARTGADIAMLRPRAGARP